MWWSMVPCPISCKSFHVLLTWWSHFPKCLSFTLLQVASIITWSMVYDYMVELSCKFPFIWWWSKWFKHAIIFMLLHYIWMLVHVVISFFKHLCYVNGDLITFCKHTYFIFWFELSCGMISCWWCNIVQHFFYILLYQWSFNYTSASSDLIHTYAHDLR